MSLTLPHILFAGAWLLLGLGIYGLLVTRNLIRLVIVIQIMTKGAMLALVAAGNFSNQASLGESLAVTVIVADTIVATIGLALAIRIQQHSGTLDIDRIVEAEG